jgi:hypothetical protein
MKSALPQELVSLVHHVHLNQEGWWDRAMERIVLATVWESKDALRPNDVPDALRTLFGVAANPEHVARAIDRLRSNNTLFMQNDGKLKVSEQRLAEIELERNAGREQEATVKARFVAEMDNVGSALDRDSTWEHFCAEWLQPTVCSLGARTYELIAGDYQDWMSTTDLDRFLRTVPADAHVAMHDVVARFLDPKDAAVRGYLLRHMDAYFMVEASRLGEDTLQALADANTDHPTFSLLFDTNVILSILGLHGAAMKDAADSLLSFTGSLSGRVNVKLYVLPQTIDETKAALNNEIESLGLLRLSRNSARAALSQFGLGDAAIAYLEAAAASDRTLTPTEFLGPFVRDLLGILRARGIELHNFATADLENRSDVLDDVQRQEEYERSRFGKRAKSRTRLIHDTVLWYVAREKRPARADGPADAQYWVVTEDYRLIAFDTGKKGADDIPVCLQPLGLAQMLQFWTGRSERMEQAIIGGLRLSLSTAPFDTKAEETTLTILRALSRFTNVGDLSQNTVAHLLINDALRQRLTGTLDEDTQIALIRDELFAEHARTTLQLKQVTTELQSLQLQSESVQSERDAAHDRSESISDELRLRSDRLDIVMKQLEQQKLELDNLVKTLLVEQSSNIQHQALITTLEHRATSLETELSQRDTRLARIGFAFAGLIFPVGILIALAIFLRRDPRISWRVSLPVEGISLCAWLVFVTVTGRSRSAIRTWPPYVLLTRLRAAIIAVFVALIIGVTVNIAYDEWYKPLRASTLHPAADSSRGPR